MWQRLRFDRLSSSVRRTNLNPLKPCAALTEQRAELRNLHQYPTARHKSLVKDRLRFARNWWLTGGNNYELVHEVGHEREATECFAEYAQDSSRDVYLMSTNRLSDLPPGDRLKAIVGLMRSRWEVKDANRGYDKAKLLLQALECFSEMKASGQIGDFNSLPEPDQDTFLQYVEGCSRFAQACSHSHPDAVRVLLRAAQICEEMRCVEKRDEMIQVTEAAANRMDRAYAFSRPHDTLRAAPPSLHENEDCVRLKNTEELRRRFGNTAPHVLEKPKRVDCLRIHRNRPLLLHPMKDNNKLLELSKLPARPEFDSWTPHQT
ncbi:hypothetical protein, conserved [Trypanosoma brucei gambiense DAL972]|uniref:Uncharacterized protein n=1 Tax=Trypanosoma brucei gambiense (strain MHOM/CI/86/DAL972) TaxID=679716 RepID=D0A426_TRYB9|nr:hypothetical protein, conserved [Trypanosoma brucei gambiense DAL972]CBH16020.1 hypothetical protein, conserved [Trypanosoma brucei gambiense DAL972]|eukprot:XP_011778284.1 hypothetical protein, conserved [Trypanosoma brucei gambiense DAL972]